MRSSILLLIVLTVFPFVTHATEAPLQDREYLAKARVVEASTPVLSAIEGTSISHETQTVTIEVMEGPERGVRATFTNDFAHVAAGDLVYIHHTIPVDGPDIWIISDPYRLHVLLVVGAVFLAVLLLFGGIQGVRALVTLAGSIVLILYVLIPNLYAGHSPLLVAGGVAALIIIAGSYVTHGFTRTTTVAMLGMLATLLVTGVGTYAAIITAQLSGYTSENNAYLNFMTDGRIDMVGLLFGGILIGLLGVLYDIAIGQAVTVEELFAGTVYTRREVYARAMRVGREHIGALVNTLAIAYVGSALPLLLLFKESDASALYLINSELFATELIRILMGSIGLVLAVPLTTLLAVWLVRPRAGSMPHAHAAHHPKNSSA